MNKNEKILITALALVSVALVLNNNTFVDTEISGTNYEDRNKIIMGVLAVGGIIWTIDSIKKFTN